MNLMTMTLILLSMKYPLIIKIFFGAIAGYAIAKVFIKLYEILTFKKDKPNGELDRHDLNYYRQYIAIADNCAKEIADDMLYNARMCERKYFYHFRNYEQALCTEDGPDMYNRVLRILCNTTGFNFHKTIERKQASL